MKKRTFLIIFMSALLCLSMMLAACSGSEVNETPTDTEAISGTETETETEAETEKVVPTDKVVDYSSILGEWAKYLTAVGVKENDLYSTATYMFKDRDTETTTYRSYISGSLARAQKITKAQYDYEGKLTSPSRVSVDFYNLKTGEKVLNVSEKGYDSDLNIYTTTYQTNVYCGAIIEIVKSVWTNLGDEETPDWQYVRSYSYYDNMGKALATNLEDAADYLSANITIAGKTYHCKNGEIILVAGENDTYVIPNFAIEYNGYRYSFGNANEDRIQVLNDNYKLTVDYLVPDYFDSYDTYILDNGDIYVTAIEQLSDNSENYNLIYNDAKYNVWHVILNVTTGEATTVDASFIVTGNLFTNYKTDVTGIKLNSGYQYAEITRIVDGTLANDVEFVILDNTLSIAATLPRIFENQTDIAYGLDNGSFVVSVDNVSGTPASYIVDGNGKNVQRFVDVNSYDTVNDGFISNGKVYNNDLEVVFDLDDVDGYRIYSGAIRYTVVESVKRIDVEIDEETEEDETIDPEETVDVIVTYIGYIDGEGKFQNVKMGTDIDTYYLGNQLHAVKTDNGMYIRNRLGKSITLSDSDTITAIDIIEKYDGCVVIRTTHDLSDSSGNYDVEYKYYIVK